MSTHGATAELRPPRLAAAVAIAGLGGAAFLHAAWARGSTWPAADRQQLTDLVVGRRASGEDGGFPDNRSTWAVAGLLTAAAALTGARAGLLPSAAGRDAHVVRLGARVVAASLLARGTGGLVLSGFDLAPTTPQFRRWNLRLYSPLCLVLGASVALVSRRAARPT